MKWFGRKAARQAGRPFLLAGLPLRFADGLEDRPASYEARVREAYLANPVAQRAARLVAESVAWAPVYALDGDAAPPPPSQPAAGMVPLPVPGRILTPALLETVATQLLLHGNAFVRVVQDALGRPGVIHLKAAHPLDDHYGLGCLGAAAAAVELHNLAARWHRSLLVNAARPSGALVYDPPDGAALSADQFARLKEELAAQFSGAANAGRPLLLDGEGLMELFRIGLRSAAAGLKAQHLALLRVA